MFKQHKGRYGSTRITLQLYNEGIESNQRVVSTLMRKEGLVSVYYRKRKASKPEKVLADYVKENILQRQFHESQLNKIFVSDITYVPCKDGMLYLSVYVELACRIPRVYQINNHLRKSIVLEPLEHLIKSTLLEGAIIHSDRGSQYRCHDYVQLLRSHGILHSMSLPGSPLDNAIAESFFKSVKTELIYPNKHKSKTEMKVLLRNYIEDYYPKERIHTSLGMTPCQYEQRILAGK